MLLEDYLNKRLRTRTVELVFSLMIAVFTQSIVSLLHEIDWDCLRLNELFILTLKEGLPSIPVVLNLSIVVAWITIKKELYHKKEVHALWLSGWTSISTIKVVISALLFISIINTFILWILVPSIRNLGPTKNTDWIHVLSNQNIEHTFSTSPAPKKIIIGKGLSDRKVINPVFIEFDNRWNIFESAYAKIDTRTIDLVDLESVLGPKQFSSLSINAMSIPIVESPSVLAKESCSLKELLKNGSPKMLGEIIWRTGLIIAPWFALLPFISLSPSLNYRKESFGELIYGLTWFSVLLIMIFMISKLPILLWKP